MTSYAERARMATQASASKAPAVNVWARRKEQMALAAGQKQPADTSSIQKPSTSSTDEPLNTLSIPSQDPDLWPEVGKSVTQPDKEVGPSAPRKSNEKPKWVPVPPDELSPPVEVTPRSSRQHSASRGQSQHQSPPSTSDRHPNHPITSKPGSLLPSGSNSAAHSRPQSRGHSRSGSMQGSPHIVPRNLPPRVRREEAMTGIPWASIVQGHLPHYPPSNSIIPDSFNQLPPSLYGMPLQLTNHPVADIISGDPGYPTTAPQNTFSAIAPSVYPTQQPPYAVSPPPSSIQSNIVTSPFPLYQQDATRSYQSTQIADQNTNGHADPSEQSRSSIPQPQISLPQTQSLILGLNEMSLSDSSSQPTTAMVSSQSAPSLGAPFTSAEPSTSFPVLNVQHSRQQSETDGPGNQPNLSVDEVTSEQSLESESAVSHVGRPPPPSTSKPVIVASRSRRIHARQASNTSNLTGAPVMFGSVGNIDDQSTHSSQDHPSEYVPEVPATGGHDVTQNTHIVRSDDRSNGAVIDLTESNKPRSPSLHSSQSTLSSSNDEQPDQKDSESAASVIEGPSVVYEFGTTAVFSDSEDYRPDLEDSASERTDGVLSPITAPAVDPAELVPAPQEYPPMNLNSTYPPYGDSQWGPPPQQHPQYPIAYPYPQPFYHDPHPQAAYYPPTASTPIPNNIHSPVAVSQPNALPPDPHQITSPIPEYIRLGPSTISVPSTRPNSTPINTFSNSPSSYSPNYSPRVPMASVAFQQGYPPGPGPGFIPPAGPGMVPIGYGGVGYPGYPPYPQAPGTHGSTPTSMTPPYPPPPDAHLLSSQGQPITGPHGPYIPNPMTRHGPTNIVVPPRMTGGMALSPLEVRLGNFGDAPGSRAGRSQPGTDVPSQVAVESEKGTNPPSADDGGVPGSPRANGDVVAGGSAMNQRDSQSSRSEWEVRDFGFGFGNVSGTGYAVQLTTLEREKRLEEQQRQRERVDEDTQVRPPVRRPYSNSVSNGSAVNGDAGPSNGSLNSPVGRENFHGRPRRGSFNPYHGNGSGNSYHDAPVRGYGGGRRGRGFGRGRGRGGDFQGFKGDRGDFRRDNYRGDYYNRDTPRNQNDSRSPQSPTFTITPNQVPFRPLVPAPVEEPQSNGYYQPSASYLGYDVNGSYQPQMLPPVPQGIQAPLPRPLTTVSFPLDPTRWYLLGQLEYYLSAQNMAQDFFLRQQMDSNGWIPIDLFVSFNRVKQLTSDINVIREVLALSAYVQLKGNAVRMQGWDQFVLPTAQPSTVDSQFARPHHQEHVGREVEEDEEEDVEFVLGNQAEGWSNERPRGATD